MLPPRTYEAQHGTNAAVVTGGGSGIGTMIASAYVKNGAKVYISGRRKDVLEKSVSELPKSAKGSLHAFVHPAYATLFPY